MTTALGLSGYTFEDLHRADRLASLYDRFCEEVRAADPAFWLEWDAYRQAPDAARPPLALSNLLTGMAPHVSRFVETLFRVDGAATGLRASTHDLDELFRFKVDFVRKRSLPLVKGGAHVHLDARAGRSLSLQGRLRPPPRASTAQGRRGRLRVRRRRCQCRADDRGSADE